ncbi:MAG TPA: phosphoglucomutase/phosphomannomutase family protein, partial [Pyrinomonadaceae bacterium]
MTTPLAEIKFGTDGWRAVIARDYTFENVERVAQAYADYLLKVGSAEPFVVIGYDRRFLSEMFAQRAAEVLAGNGLRISLFNEAVPTPLISWAVKQLNAQGGVVITASHNPPDFNGFKIKAPWGGSASPATTAAVEKLIDAQEPKRKELANKQSELLAPAIKSYRAQIASYIDLDRLRKAKASVVV